MNPKRTSLGRALTLSLALLALVGGLGACAPWARTVSVPQARPAASACPAFDSASERDPLAVVTWAHDLVERGPAPAPALDPPAPALDPPAPTEACPDQTARVLLVGDSLSVGLGPVMARLARECGTSFFHHGVVGAHVTQWAQDSWLLPQLERAQPNLVVVSLGGNDFQRNDPAAVEAAVASMVTKVRARGAKLLWISPPTMPFDDAVGARVMWQRALDGQIDRDWFPTEMLEIPRARDRVHPTIAGYHDLGRRLWSWIATAS